MPIVGISWALFCSRIVAGIPGWAVLIVLALVFSVALHFLVMRLSDGPRSAAVGSTSRALLGLSMVPVAFWAGRSIGLGNADDGLGWVIVPSIAVAGLLAGFLPFRRSLKGPWLLDLVASAGAVILSTALLAKGLVVGDVRLAAWGWEICLAVGFLALLGCLILQGTAVDLIDVRLRWQRFAYLSQWPLPVLFLGWGWWIGLPVCLLAWWDLIRIGRSTAGGRVVFEGTTELLSIPAFAALLTLTADGHQLGLPALALFSRFGVGWLSAGPYVALLMAVLPDPPQTSSSALEFVAPALLTISLGSLLIRPIGWLWAWGGWVAWLIVMEPPIGLAVAIGTLPALAGVVRLAYRYEPRPLAIALVSALAAAAILAFGHGPIASLRAVLIDWGGALRAGTRPSPIGPDGLSGFAGFWPATIWVLSIPFLGYLAHREWTAQRPGRVTPAMVLELGTLGVVVAMIPWTLGLLDGGDPGTRSVWLAQWIVVGLLPVILLANRQADRAVPIAWGVAALSGLLGVL